MTIEIRPETPADHREVESLTREAFWNVYHPGCTEHLIVHNLRNDPVYVPELSRIIVDDGAVVAHVAYSNGRLDHSDGTSSSLLILGPVSVTPERQGEGLGARIIEHTLELANERGDRAVVLTGNPDYYRRFGFEPASDHGIANAGFPAGEPAPYFMIRILDAGAGSDLTGTFRDPDVFFPSEREVDEFDRSFPAKEKKVLPGQLG